MRHCVEIWTVHTDGTTTLVREFALSAGSAQLRIEYLHSMLEEFTPHGYENDSGEVVTIEPTVYAIGKVKAGVFHFAYGE